MCGRFTVTTPVEDLVREFALEPPDEALPPRFNVAPTQPVPALLSDEPRRLHLLRWGLIPSWAEDPGIGSRLINARAESLGEKPAFRKALERRRCLVLADGFFEWRKEGRKRWPVLLRLRTRKPFSFAGLWEPWKAPDGSWVRSCTIVTVPANDLVAPIHDRMPAILPAGARDAWLHAPAAEARALLVPFPAEEMEAIAVSPRVNSPAVDDPSCLEPPPPTLPFPDP